MPALPEERFMDKRTPIYDIPARPKKRLKPLSLIPSGDTELKPGASASRQTLDLPSSGAALAPREDYYFTFFTFSQRPVFADFSTESVT
jgi:hypothetical protein